VVQELMSVTGLYAGWTYKARKISLSLCSRVASSNRLYWYLACVGLYTLELASISSIGFFVAVMCPDRGRTSFYVTNWITVHVDRPILSFRSSYLSCKHPISAQT